MPPVRHHEEVRIDGRTRARLELGHWDLEGSRNGLVRWARTQGDDRDDLSRGLGQALDPVAEEVTDVGGQRSVECTAGESAGTERSGELEGVKWIAASDLVDPHERRPRQWLVEAIGDEPVQLPEGETAQLEAHVTVAKQALDREPTGLDPFARRRQHADVRVPEAPERHVQDRAGRRVQPLEVVDRQDDATPNGEPSEKVQDRDPELALIDAGTIGSDSVGCARAVLAGSDAECALEPDPLRCRE